MFLYNLCNYPLMRYLIPLLAILLLAACMSEGPIAQKDCAKEEESLFGGPDICYVQQAKELNDVNICKKIKLNNFYPVCVAHIAAKERSLSLCADMNSMETLKEVYGPERVNAALAKQFTRHCIYRQYNEENTNGGVDTPPDDYLDYASYAS